MATMGRVDQAARDLKRAAKSCGNLSAFGFKRAKTKDYANLSIQCGPNKTASGFYGNNCVYS